MYRNCLQIHVTCFAPFYRGPSILIQCYFHLLSGFIIHKIKSDRSEKWIIHNVAGVCHTLWSNTVAENSDRTCVLRARTPHKSAGGLYWLFWNFCELFARTLCEDDCHCFCENRISMREKAQWNYTTIFISVIAYFVFFFQEWTDYDEKANVSVSIMELESQFIKTHK